EILLRPEMVREGALRRASGRDDVAHGAADIARMKHHLQARIENVFAIGWLWHNELIRTYVLIVNATARTRIKHLTQWLILTCRIPGALSAAMIFGRQTLTTPKCSGWRRYCRAIASRVR